MQFFGPNVGPEAVKAKQNIFSLLGVDCRNLNEFSYGSVDVNSKTGIAKFILKDENGRVIKDQLNPEIECTKTFGTSTSPASQSFITAGDGDVTSINNTKSIEESSQQQQQNKHTNELYSEHETARQIEMNNSRPVGAS